MTNNCNSVNHTHLIFRSVKAATEAWIDLEDESEEEEIDGEEKEKEEETYLHIFLKTIALKSI